MKQSIISVIVPVYNLEKYISRCLDSILSQTYSNLQILVINDGSTDGSAEVISHYAQIDSRITFIDKCNEGVSVARNVGIDSAEGEYIMFVDGDDWVDCDIVEQLYSLAISTNADCVRCGYVFEDLSSCRKRYSSSGFGVKCIYGKDILHKFLIGYHLPGSVWAGLYKKTLLSQWNISFTKGIRYGEDEFFNAQFFAKTTCVAISDTHLYHVMVRESSVTRRSVHETQNENQADYVDFLMREGLWDEYQQSYKTWFVRSTNYKLYHLALKVGLDEYVEFYKRYITCTGYLEWNTMRIRKQMSLRNKILSLCGKSAYLSWCIVNIPTIFGKKILV